MKGLSWGKWNGSDSGGCSRVVGEDDGGKMGWDGRTVGGLDFCTRTRSVRGAKTVAVLERRLQDGLYSRRHQQRSESR